MATPAMILQNVFANVASHGSTTLRIDTFNLDGTALDVSSGYTLDSATARPGSSDNPLKSSVDISSACSAAFDASGVTITVNGGTLAPLLPCLTNQAQFNLSNDAGSTNQPAAVGTLSLSVLPADA